MKIHIFRFILNVLHKLLVNITSNFIFKKIRNCLLYFFIILFIMIIICIIIQYKGIYDIYGLLQEIYKYYI